MSTMACTSKVLVLFVVVTLSCALVFSAHVISNTLSSASACMTPSQQSGKCIYSTNCPVYQEAYERLGRNYTEYFRQLQCGYEDSDYKVCCITDGTYNITTRLLPSGERTSRERTPSPLDIGLRIGSDDLLPSRDVCGIQTFGNKIFAGEIADIDEFPWMALLFYKHKPLRQQYYFACGGALINDRYVLTAAHCVSGPEFERLGGLDMVRLGEYNVDTQKDCIEELGNSDCSDPPVDALVDKILVHPDYKPNATNHQNDIALIRLADAVEFTDFIKPVCLPNAEVFSSVKMNAGERLYVAGWGKNESGLNSPVKLKLKVPIVEKENCAKVYRGYKINLDHTQICAGGEKGKDSCKGDSGGPLMSVDTVLGNWVVSGVVSIGPNSCGKSGVPGIYTNVKDFVPWIKSIVTP